MSAFDSSSSSSPLIFSELEHINLIRTRSSSGSIYSQVLHRATGDLFTLKKIPYRNPNHRVLREIEIFRSIDHPNLLKCHAFSHPPQGSGHMQILLDFIPDTSLQGNHITDEPSLADLSRQILSALSYLHRFNIVHEGVKTSNLLLLNSAQVKLLDCIGEKNDDDDEGEFAGDIWGFGLSILELYLGRPPSEVEIKEVVEKRIPSEVAIEDIFGNSITSEFRHFISCCLEKDSGNRWTANQLLQHPFIERDSKILTRSSLVNELGGTLEKRLKRDMSDSISSKPPKRRATATTFYSASPGEFRKKVMELTGVTVMNTPHQTVNVGEDRKAEVENESVSAEPIVEHPKNEPSLPGIEVTVQAPENMTRQLKSCITYCCLFPVGYELERDSLVQLWIAEGLINVVENERMEDIGNLYFDYLSKWEYVVPSGYDHFGDQVTYRVGEAMAAMLEKESLAPLYCRVEGSHLADVSILSMHLSLVCDYIDQMTFEALKRYRNLRTLLLLGHYGSSVKHMPRDLFLGLELLRTLDLSCIHLFELPTSIGNVKSLRYLDVSETQLKRLPESVDCLRNLQTLRLRGCLGLVRLPKYIRKLVNLRHLDFDIARQLKSMPTGMGNLVSLQTLRAFLVGREDGCRIGELKNMNNLSGSLCIWGLENVLNKKEAKVAALSNKQYLSKLELRWSDLRDAKVEDEEEIIECLRPPSGLKELQILFYRGSKLPSWISCPSFVNIASITLYKCTNCSVLPSIGKLPSLKSLTLVEMNSIRDVDRLFCRDQAGQGYQAFPMLEKLTFDVMLNLEEWTGVENGDFPCLLQLTMKYCPKLISLPLLLLLKSLEYLEISHCQELPSFPDGRLPASLAFLMVRDCPTLKERCRKGEGEDWFKIEHVPSIWIDHQDIFLPY